MRQMNSMPNPKQTDPHDVAVAALKEAYEQIERADKQLPRVNEQVSKSERDAARHPSDQQKRPAVPGRRSSRGRRALQGLIGLLMAACIGAAAIALRPDGDEAKQMFTGAVPQLDPISSPASENLVPAQLNPPAVQNSAAEATPPQPAPLAVLAQTASQDAAPTAAAPSPGQAQLLESMASDLVAAKQEIEQLKASQEQVVRDIAELAEQLKAAQAQMARDNENAAEQLRASQEQLARLVAKASEQNLPPKTSPLPPRAIAPPTRKQVPKLSSPQTNARTLAPVQRTLAPVQKRPEQQ